MTAARTLCLLGVLLAACAPVALSRPLVKQPGLHGAEVSLVDDKGVAVSLDDIKNGRQLQSQGPIVNVKISLKGIFDESQITVLSNAIKKVLTDAGVKFDAVKYLSKIDVVGKRKLLQLTDTLYVLEFEVLGLLDTAQADLAIVTLSLIPIEAAVVDLVKAVITAVVPILVSLLG